MESRSQQKAMCSEPVSGLHSSSQRAGRVQAVATTQSLSVMLLTYISLAALDLVVAALVLELWQDGHLGSALVSPDTSFAP